MSVIVRPISIVGSPPESLSFSDTFNRTSSGSIGTDWAVGCFVKTPYTVPNGGLKPSIATAGDAAQALSWGYTGTANPIQTFNGSIIPMRILRLLTGRTQFAQATFVESAANSTSGLMVCARADVESHYILLNAHTANLLALLRFNDSTGTTLVASVRASKLVAGEIVRLSADLSVAGQVTLTTTIAGVIINTFVDNNAFRLTVGAPGIGATDSFNQTGFQRWRNFSCGPGL